jgi:hypothetical protein
MMSVADPPRAGDGRAPLNSLQVVQEIVRRLDLYDAQFTFVSHSVHADRRQRHRTADERLKDAAREFLGEPTEFLGEPIGQQVRGSRLVELSLADLDEYRMASHHVVSISSRFELRGSWEHLPLMDLCLDEFLSLERLETVVKKLCRGRDFRLLRTDRHYHVYGCFVLREGDEWKYWNIRFQMTNALTDGRYITQSLVWGCNLLRLNAGEIFQMTVPVTVGEDHRPGLGRLSEAAVKLAQRRHSWQVRKSGESIVRHLEEVAELAVEIGNECAASGNVRAAAATADELYACGYLHDCIEDTNTDYDDVATASGVRVADWVVELSEDKRLPARQRHERYCKQIRGASLPARIVKLADLLSNLRGLRGHEDQAWIAGYLHRVDRQLQLIRPGLDGCRAFDQARRLVEQRRNLLAARNPARVGGPDGQHVLTVPGKPVPVQSAEQQQLIR